MNVITQFPAALDYDPDLRFRAMFEGAAIGIGICQLDGRILEANAAFSEMLGYSQQELTGTHSGNFFPAAHAELHRETGGETGHEMGREIYPAGFLPDEQSLGELLRGERDSFEVEKRYRRKDGSELWGHLTVSLGRDARRRPAFLIAMLADATERRRTEERLRQAEKMEVIGRLAGGIAHDFNNLLTGILLYCDLLSAGLENIGLASGGLEPGELRRHVEELRMAGEQGAALTHQLLAIARKQAAEPRPVSVNGIVASTENLLQRLIGEPIELVTALDSGAGLVLADPAQLRQILLNLVLNARDAMPRGGKISLITRAAEFPGAEPPADAESGSARRAVLLAVQDNGCGMDEEARARLFEPFFTTKNPGEGTGLGLATVRRIVDEAGGRIEVESELGRGTRIAVLLPALESSAQTSSSEASTPVPRAFAGNVARDASGKNILLVDDHPVARKSMQRVLLEAGYRILVASSAKEALKVFAEHSSAVDLLIADCVMPEMNGQELAETLRRQKPGLKVLLVSGYEQAPAGSAAGTVKLVRKPFSGRALIERVVEVMRSP
jgi:signal transduction histidine kinase